MTTATPDLTTLREFAGIMSTVTGCNDAAIDWAWEQAVKRAAQHNQGDKFTPSQQAQIDKAYDILQAEESRDREYNFELCQHLRDQYRGLIEQFRAENRTALAS